MTINYLKPVLFALLIVGGSCKTAKKTATTSTRPDEKGLTEVVSILKKWTANEIKADWLAGEVDVDYKGKPLSTTAGMTVRFRRDSVIWFNVKKLLFNVARAKITPDSIFLINYLQREYVAEGLGFLEKKYNLPADFNLIQNLMLGNPIFLTDKNKLTLEKDATSGAPILRGSDAKWSATYKLSATGELLEEMYFEQIGTGRTLKILYKNYDILRGYAGDSRKMAFTRELYLESPQTGKASVILDVNADGLEINIPKNIRFEIPDGYDKRK